MLFYPTNPDLWAERIWILRVSILYLFGSQKLASRARPGPLEVVVLWANSQIPTCPNAPRDQIHCKEPRALAATGSFPYCKKNNHQEVNCSWHSRSSRADKCRLLLHFINGEGFPCGSISSLGALGGTWIWI